MILKVSTEQRIFNILEYQRRKELENLNNFSVKIRPELKIANFLLQFCKSSSILRANLFKILDFDRNNLFSHF